MERISVVIAAYNERRHMADCLASVAWADEVIVVDGGSNDGSAEIAAAAGAQVLVRPNQLIPEINKNIGLDAASGAWILSLDADERIPAGLAGALRSFVAAPGEDVAVRMARQNYMLGAWSRHGSRWPDYQIRFFKRGALRFQERLHRQPVVQGPLRTLPPLPDLAMTHYPYVSLSAHLQRLDTYTTTEAETLLAQGAGPSLRRLMLFPVFVFVRDYVVWRGILDGVSGFILSVWSAFYAFLTWAKLWEMARARRQRSP